MGFSKEFIKKRRDCGISQYASQFTKLEKTGYTNRNRLMIATVGKRMVVPGCWLEEHEEA